MANASPATVSGEVPENTYDSMRLLQRRIDRMDAKIDAETAYLKVLANEVAAQKSLALSGKNTRSEHE